MRAPTYRPILALQNEPDRAGLVRVDGEGVARKKWDDDTGPPRGLLPVSADNPANEGVTNAILDGNAVDDGRGYEELILYVHEMVGHLDSCIISARSKGSKRCNIHLQ